MVTVAGPLLSEPSFTVKLKLSGPFRLAFGVYVTCAEVAVRGVIALNTPRVGPVPIANPKQFPSASVPVRVIVTAVSSAVVTDCALATGASFTGVTVILTVAGELVEVPSLT